jgi:hypothetical protein
VLVALPGLAGRVLVALPGLTAWVLVALPELIPRSLPVPSVHLPGPLAGAPAGPGRLG